MTARFAPALLALALAACSAPQQDAATSATPPAPTAAPAPAAPAATLSAQTLGAYHWDLTQAVDAKGQPISALLPNPQRPLRVDFNGDRLGVSGGCNRGGGSFKLEGDKLVAGQLAQTMMACPDTKLMEADTAIGARLSSSPTLQLGAGDPPTLTLRTADGDVLTFNGVPTAETRFGGPGTQVFMEVAAQRKPCSHPLIPNMQCLQVREVRYDDKGLKTGTGDWQALYQDIEGYEHVDGVRNVLRLKKYDVKNPPADASSVAYVLDMVVESENVKAK